MNDDRAALLDAWAETMMDALRNSDDGDHAYRIALEEKLTERWAWRSWYRNVARPLFGNRWDDLAAENAADLRRLVRQLRRVRGRVSQEDVK